MTRKLPLSGTRAAITAPVLALCLLGGVWVTRLVFRPALPNAEAYHRNVRDQISAIPMRMGAWVGTDIPAPPSAVRLFRPNAVLARRYQHASGRHQVVLLLVHCRDTRDLLGHWPPVCYVGRGWTSLSATPSDWRVDDLAVTGTRYTFDAGSTRGTSRVTVDGFFILPGGRICRDLDDLDAHARDPRRRPLGAAQVQVLSNAMLTDRERDDALRVIVRSAAPAIHAIGQEVTE